MTGLQRVLILLNCVLLTLGLSRGMNGVTLPIVILGTIRPEDSRAARNASIKLHSETQVSGRLGMSGGRSPRHAQNPLSGEQRKMLSKTHHALSSSHHHLYIIHLINVFIVLQCHLKVHLCRKVM